MSADLGPMWLVVLIAATVAVLLGVPAIDRWNDQRRNRRWAAQQQRALDRQFTAITASYEEPNP